MASKIKETHALSIEGVVDLDDSEEIMIYVDGYENPFSFNKLIRKFNGANCKFSVRLANEIVENPED